MADKIQELIKRAVAKNFPGIADPFLYNESTYTEINISAGDESRTDSGHIEDGSGRRYFIMGESAWGGDDIIGE